MLPKFPISDEKKNYIRHKISEIERNHHVQVLLAIESGSRAWGFPSLDSDYDVRFIYVRTKNNYLSVNEWRDVIETPSYHDQTLDSLYDMNGWDIRKALQLALKSNPVLVEWLVSPITYQKHSLSVEKLLDFVQQASNTNTLCYHYDRQARRAWEQMEQMGNQVRVKTYCYALRPALVTQWILQHNSLPPMDMTSLCEGVVKDNQLYKEIARLIEGKAQSQEGDFMPRNRIIDDYISSILQHKAEHPKMIAKNETIAAAADNLFREILENIS
ncbi:MAG: nucleotidyltransferase domain-containing protein [Alphaproteobacteria bacterium]|nr:nucleotidyltransferase domain-containing protein [Alphaproteobacteria bacterium]